MGDLTKYDPLNKLKNVHPVLQRKLLRVLLAMETLGFVMRVTDGARTLEQQQALYAQGRTLPGKIVTDADGKKTPSNHQVTEDGFGHAADCCFIDDQGHLSWQEHFPWSAYGEAAKAVGLEWGGHWQTPDRPHIQLPKGVA